MRKLVTDDQAFQWKSTPDVLAVCDSHRHLGHAFRFDDWHAFDATKLNDTANGFCYLGSFKTIDEARLAIGESLKQPVPAKALRVMTAR